MLVVMERHATEAQVAEVVKTIEALGFKAHPMPGATRTAIGITGNQGYVESKGIELLPGVEKVVHVTKPYKLVGRDARPDDSIIEVGKARFGSEEFCVIAGPCAVESEAQVMTIAECIASAGLKLFRGGAYKPRTSPYSFQGLGLEALKLLAKARDRFGLAIVTEAIDHESLGLVEEYADMIQIGARNMQNFSLLRRAGKSKRPVLLKRGMSATIEEFLLSAEYVMSEGNYNVVLCERGVRTFADHTRNTLDLSAVPAVKRASHLPIIVDPSHGTGRREKVLPMSRASFAVGADGLMIEVHHDPEHALSDGPQAILPGQFASLVAELRGLAPVLHRSI
ncbi:MAG: 3-deoxy-7-phosphoheptulonate synthase [Acidobacteriota bacterium]